jgi:hypothetical protein
MFESRYVSCENCGASLEREERDEHACEPERRLDFQVFLLRDELETFEEELDDYLSSPRGRFEVWYATRTRPGRS